MKVRLIIMISVVLTAMGTVYLASCGSNTATSITNELAQAMGTVAITSPAASSSSTASLYQRGQRAVFSMLHFFGLRFLYENSPRTHAADSTSAPTNVKDIDTMKTEVINTVNSTDPAAAATALGNPIDKTNYSTPCYGPSWTDNARGSNVNRPSGDLGMVYKTASDTDTRACAAAQVDALIAGTPSFLNNFVKMQAIMLAQLKKNGGKLPDVGTTTDLTTTMPTLTGITFTNVDLKQLAVRSDGNEIYKTIFEFTSSSKTGTVTIFHTPLNDANTNFEGIIYAQLPYTATMNGTGTRRGMSMVYSQVDGVLKMSVKTTADRTSNTTSFFNSSNEVDFSLATSSREDFHWIIGEFNTTTNEAKMHYAWQAGGNDGATRTFAFYVPAGTDGSLTGTAWAGYGLAISSLTAGNTPWTAKFYCDWLDGLSNGTAQTKVQRQGMSQTGGKFLVNEANNFISFSPKANCNGNFTISGAGSTFLNGNRTVTSNDLVAAPSSTEAPAVTVPAYAIPTE